jgi:hypothetical protein
MGQIHCFLIRCRPVHYECNLEVRRLLKAGIAEPKKTVVAREQLGKHASKATKSCDHGNRYVSNNRRAAGGGVLCWVREELYQESLQAVFSQK